MGLTAHGLYSLKLHAFEFEEKLLCGKAAAIAGEASVAAYDAVAGSEDRNGVRAVGCAYRPYCLRVTNHLGHPAIAPGLPVRDFQQGVPDFFLKLGADEQKRQIECLASPGKYSSSSCAAFAVISDGVSFISAFRLRSNRLSASSLCSSAIQSQRQSLPSNDPSSRSPHGE